MNHKERASRREKYPVSMRLGVNVTRDCNCSCYGCNRLLDAAKMPGCDVTPEQVHKAVGMFEGMRIYLWKITLCGGEPTLHPRLVEICEAAISRQNVGYVQVSTNGCTPRPPLPPKCQYKISPPNDKSHFPFLVSPHDIGVRKEFIQEDPTACRLMHGCGVGFDREGFTFCLLAGGLGRLLGKNVYGDRPVLARDMDVCRHCIQGTNLQTDVKYRKSLDDAVKLGVVSCPSRTFAEGLKRWNSGDTSPYPLPAWQGETP